MLSAPHMARFGVRLIAIRRCPPTRRYPKAWTCSTMDNLSSNDLQIFREKSRTFCGSVKIPLDKICHEELPHNPRQFNEKNVTTLLDFFRSEGCLRLDPENYVPALISRSAVPRALHPGGEPPRFVSYRQLWLFALRHFPVMDGQSPRRDKTKQSALHEGRQPRRWYELWSLASENGYR